MQKENKLAMRERNTKIIAGIMLLTAALSAYFKLLDIAICLIITIIGLLFFLTYLFFYGKNLTGLNKVINWIYISFLIFVEISLIYFLFIIW